MSSGSHPLLRGERASGWVKGPSLTDSVEFLFLNTESRGGLNREVVLKRCITVQ